MAGVKSPTLLPLPTFLFPLVLLPRCHGRTRQREGRQWQLAPALLCEMSGAMLEPTLIGYNARINACEKGQWQPVLTLRCEMLGGKLDPLSRYSTGISACEKGQWQPALALLCGMAGAKSPILLPLPTFLSLLVLLPRCHGRTRPSEGRQ